MQKIEKKLSPPARFVALRTLLHLLLLWPAALWLAWLALSQVNFWYPLNYRLLDIPATIAQYAGYIKRPQAPERR